MTQQSNSGEEVDLKSVFSGARKGYHHFLIWVYRGIGFIFHRWYIVLGTIGLGIFLGYVLSHENNKEKAELNVQLNYNSTYNVYNALDQLNGKLEKQDTAFLKKAGFIKNGKLLIEGVAIRPVADISDIIHDKGLSYSNIRYLQALFDKSDIKGDLLTSELLLPQYKTHQITLVSSVDNGKAAFNALLDFLNDNPLMTKIKKVSRANTQQWIEENNKSIAAIDSIVKGYGQNPQTKTASGSLYFNYHDLQNDNIHLLFNEKSNLLRDNQELKVQLLKGDKVVKLLNRPELHPIKKGLLSKKMMVLPILFLFILFLIVQFRRLYRKAERLNAEAVQNGKL